VKLMTYLFLKTFIIGPILHVLFRPWSTGSENVPKSGGAILASNHLSFSDSIFLPLKCSRPVTFLAKSDYFTGKGLKGLLTRWFFKATGQIPIDRSGGKASEASLNTGLSILAKDYCLEFTQRVPVLQTAPSIVGELVSPEWFWRLRCQSFQLQ